jgi:hypothetical protein
VEPETYRMLVGRYRDQVLAIVDRFGGHVGSTKGDGLLAVFGYPMAHEDDVRRAVLAGVEITREVARSANRPSAARLTSVFGWVWTRTGVSGHRAGRRVRASRKSGGPGIGPGPPGTVCGFGCGRTLDQERQLPRLQTLTPAAVKGVDELIAHHLVMGERRLSRPGWAGGPLVGRDREWRGLARVGPAPRRARWPRRGGVSRRGRESARAAWRRQPPSWSRPPARWCWS